MQQRESIRIAFEDSRYATPYGDNSIQGNKSHYPLPPRLGRRYADYHCQLSNALIAPGREGISASEEAAAAAAVAAANGEARQRAVAAQQQEQQAREARNGSHNNSCSLPAPSSSISLGDNTTSSLPRHKGESLICAGGGQPRPCLRGSENYILNVKNGGRRHFAEERGHEAVWRSSMRLPDISRDDEEKPHPTGKGFGVYNMDDKTSMHPLAHAALLRREELKHRCEAGKAMVAGPPNHSTMELGLWIPEQFGDNRLSSSAEQQQQQQDGANPEAPRTLAREGEGESATPQPKDDVVASSVNRWGGPGRVCPVDGLSVAPPQRVAFDVASSLQAGKVAVKAVRTARTAYANRLIQNEDIEAVRRLPDI